MKNIYAQLLCALLMTSAAGLLAGDDGVAGAPAAADIKKIREGLKKDGYASWGDSDVSGMRDDEQAAHVDASGQKGEQRSVLGDLVELSFDVSDDSGDHDAHGQNHASNLGVKDILAMDPNDSRLDDSVLFGISADEGGEKILAQTVPSLQSGSLSDIDMKSSARPDMSSSDDEKSAPSTPVKQEREDVAQMLSTDKAETLQPASSSVNSDLSMDALLNDVSDIEGNAQEQVRHALGQRVSQLEQRFDLQAAGLTERMDNVEQEQGKLAVKIDDYANGMLVNFIKQNAAIDNFGGAVRAHAQELEKHAGSITGVKKSICDMYQVIDATKSALAHDIDQARKIAEKGACLTGVVEHIQTTQTEMLNRMPAVPAEGSVGGSMLVTQDQLKAITDLMPVVYETEEDYNNRPGNTLVIAQNLRDELLKVDTHLDRRKQNQIPQEQLQLLAFLAKYGPTALKTGMAYGISSEFALIEQLVALLNVYAQAGQIELGKGALLLDAIKQADCQITSALLNGVQVTVLPNGKSQLSFSSLAVLKNGVACAVTKGAELAVDACAQTELGKRLNIAQKVKNASPVAKGVAFTVATTLVQTHVVDPACSRIANFGTFLLSDCSQVD